MGINADYFKGDDPILRRNLRIIHDVKNITEIDPRDIVSNGNKGMITIDKTTSSLTPEMIRHILDQ